MNEGLAQHDAVGLSMFGTTASARRRPRACRQLRRRPQGRQDPRSARHGPSRRLRRRRRQHAEDRLLRALHQPQAGRVVTGEENPVFTILADSLFETQDELALTNHYFDCQVLLSTRCSSGGPPARTAGHPEGRVPSRRRTSPATASATVKPPSSRSSRRRACT